MSRNTYDLRIEQLLALLPTLTAREYAKLAIACADQAGLSGKLQADFETALVEQVSEDEMQIGQPDLDVQCSTLRDKGVSDHDRDVVLEFAASIQGRPPSKPARDRLAEIEAKQRVTEKSMQPHIPVREKAAYVRSQHQTRKHHCHWPGCTTQVPPAMWGCRTHWFRLPKALRDRIWRAYVPGQEVDTSPSETYLQVADDVQRWIRGRPQGVPRHRR